MAIVLGTVAAQLGGLETAILQATFAHPERHGALLTERPGVGREVHPADLAWIEGWTTKQTIREAKRAVGRGDLVTAGALRNEVRRRWALCA